MPPADRARRNTLPRTRRLKRQRLIRALFDRTRSDVQMVRAGGLVIRYRLASPDETGRGGPLQVGFATGRQIGAKPARNRIKRVMRECFRVHQHALVDLFSARPDTLTLMILFRGKDAGAEAAIARDLPRLLDRIAERFTTPHPSPDG